MLLNKFLKYCLISALISGILWLILYYFLYDVIGVSGLNLVIAGISSYIGTFMGLSYIGKIRKPSLVYGIIVGAFSFISVFLFRILLTSALGYMRFWNNNYLLYMQYLINDIGLSLAIFIFAGVFAGLIIIHRTSPSFCPYCGASLSPGHIGCKKCGQQPASEISRAFIFGILILIVVLIIFNYVWLMMTAAIASAT